MRLRVLPGILLLIYVTLGLPARLLAAEGPAPAPLELTYTVRVERPTTHLVDMEIVARKVGTPMFDFVMPAWAPGRYAIYDFAKNVQEFSAPAANGQPLPWSKLDKQTWRVEAAQAGGTVERVTGFSPMT